MVWAHKETIPTMNNKRFCAYSNDELLALTEQQLQDAIRIEAIERGINPPITLPEALKNSEWTGYRHPGNAVKVFRIKCGYHTTQFGWLKEEQAIAAMEGMVTVEENSYSRPQFKITSEAPQIVISYGANQDSYARAAKFEEYMDEKHDDFVKLVEECVEKLGNLRQERYNEGVRQTKKVEYLRLAGGDEAIARAFWSKCERTEWPL